MPNPTQFDPDAFMAQQNPAAFDPDAFMAKKTQSDAPTEQPGLLDDVGDTLKQYWNKINPVTQAQGVADIVTTNPAKTAKAYGDTNAKLYESAKDSFKKGEYSEGVRHSLSYFLNAIPGLGAALDEAGNKAGSGDYKGAIADTAALATQIGAGKVGPAVLDAATEPGALANAANVVAQPARTAVAVAKGAAQGAWDGATEPVAHGRFGLKVPASLANAGVGGYVGSHVGLPGVGAVVGGAYPLIKGAVRGGKLALEDLRTPPSVEKIPLSAESLPENVVPINTPGVAPVLKPDLSLEGVPFDKLHPALQKVVLEAAGKEKSVPASPAPPSVDLAPPPSVEQVAAPEPQGAEKPRTQSQIIDDELRAGLDPRTGKSRILPQPPAPQSPAQPAPAPAPPQAQPLAPPMNGAPPEGAYPIPEEAKTQPLGAPREAYEAAARTAKARGLARWLNSAGVKYEQAASLKPEDWAREAAAAHYALPSPKTIEQALNELKLMQAQPTPVAPPASLPPPQQVPPPIPPARMELGADAAPKFAKGRAMKASAAKKQAASAGNIQPGIPSSPETPNNPYR